MSAQASFDEDYVLDETRQWRGVYSKRINASDEDVVRTLGHIKRTGISEDLYRWMEEDRIAAGKQAGPKPAMDFAAVLALYLTLACAGQAMTTRNAANLARYGLSDHTHRRLGIELDEKTTADAVYDRIDRAFHRLLAVVDPEPGQRRQKMSREARQKHLESLDEDAVRMRRERVHQICNALIVQSYKDLPREVRRRWKGNAVVDGTVVPVHSRGHSKTSQWISTEYEAGWYQRKGDHFLDDDAPTQQLKNKGIFGYDAAIVSMATNDPSRVTTFPQLAVGMSFDKPAVEPGLNAIIALEQMSRAGLPTRLIIGDRAYGNSPLAENFQIPARELGYQLLFDMKVDDLGKPYDEGHFIVLEGNLYSPALRGKENLIKATVHYRVDKSIDYDTWQKRLEQRAKYMLQPHEAATREGGGQQMRCPAAGPNPTVACPLRPRDIEAETGKHLALLPIMPKNVPAEHTRGKLCTNAGGTSIIRGPVYDRQAMDPRIQFGTPGTPPPVTPSSPSMPQPRTAPEQLWRSLTAAVSAATRPTTSSPLCC